MICVASAHSGLALAAAAVAVLVTAFALPLLGPAWAAVAPSAAAATVETAITNGRHNILCLIGPPSLGLAAPLQLCSLKKEV
jgi:hypothetical protein